MYVYIRKRPNNEGEGHIVKGFSTGIKTDTHRISRRRQLNALTGRIYNKHADEIIVER